MSRRLCSARLVRHSTFAAAAHHSTRLTESVVRDVLHRFEVCAVLECHAAQCAALAPHRDVQAAACVLASLDHAVATGRYADWNGLDLQFHRALGDQAGNQVLAAMAARMQSDVQTVYARYLSGPVYTQRQLRVLQSHHRSILRCIVDGQAEEAVQLTRAHVHFERDQVIAALTRPSPA